MIFAVITEIIQHYTGYRSFSYFDLLADLLGMLAALLLHGPLKNKILKKHIQFGKK